MEKKIARMTEERQLAYLDAHGLDQKLYHNRDVNGGVTVCLVLRKGTVVARGVSICSPLDHFHRSFGRAVARGRALRAVRKERDTGAIERRTDSITNPALTWAWSIFPYKSSWMPQLTPFEETLIGPKETGGP